MFFKFSTYAGNYARVIDFLNSASDAGIYIISNCLNFYPNGNVGTCPNFVDGNYYLITLVRDGATNQIKIYVNGVLFSTYNDSAKVYASNGGTTPILFFRDDNAVACEVRSGNVRYISLTPTLNTDAEVRAVFDNLCTGILPIKLVSFTAQKTGISKTLLRWQTSSEINASHYEVERSTDGMSFSPLERIAAQNRQGTHDYNFTDKFAKNGINFYRLKMVDIDGTFVYSKIEKVSDNAIGAALKVIYADGPFLQVSSGWLDGTASLINTSAQVLSTFKLTNSLQKIPLDKYPNGVYFLRVKKANEVVTLKIVK